MPQIAKTVNIKTVTLLCSQRVNVLFIINITDAVIGISEYFLVHDY